MSKQNKNFLALLSLLNLDSTNDLNSGELDKVDIKKKEFSIKFYISLPQIIEIDKARFLMERIKNHFLKMGYQQVEVQFNYHQKQISDDILESYFKNFVSYYEQEKTRYCCLHNFNKLIADSKIIIYVANEDEQNMIKSLVQKINQEFKCFGLNSEIEIVVSGFETPIEKIIEENNNRNTQEVLRDQEKYEATRKKAQTQDNNNGYRRVKKKPRLKQDLLRDPTPLKNIPASETDVIEYQQRHSRTDFVIVADIVEANIVEKVRREDSMKFKIFEALVSDGSDSITIKTFIDLNVPEQLHFYELATQGKRIRAYGNVSFDRFSNDVVLKVSDMDIVGDADKNEIPDNAPVRRVELHAHTKMSMQDSVMDIDDYVKQAVKYKHRALAVTDHHNIHILPDLYLATKDLDITPIFGVEGELVDENNFKIALTDNTRDLHQASFVVYDVETTGLSSKYNEIIEIAAVKIKNGMIIDEFSCYVKPKEMITDFITDLTSITNDDVRGADSIDVVLPKFKVFIKDCILVAHNASFDNSHLYENLKRLNIYDGPIDTIDTLQLAKVRYGHKLKKFNLKAVAKYFDVELEQHHRAIYDAKTTAYIFMKMLNDFIDSGIVNYNQINQVIDEKEAFKLDYPNHCTILSKNPVGKKNLYKIISDSHTVHFARQPRILKSFLKNHREGLLIGSGCINGEVFKTAFQKGDDELKSIIGFYDYIEVQPPSICEVLVEKNKDENVREYIKDTIKTIIRVAKELNKIVVATGDVHHIKKEDSMLREIYISAPKIGGGTHDLFDIEKLPSFHFMTTQEMLDEFSFLGNELAYEIVVTNTNLIADQIERYPLFPDELFAPSDDFMKDHGIPSFKQGVIDMTYENAKQKYGENLPQYVIDRLEKELNSIIGNNFASIYYISYLLVKHSIDAGYVVGSRGSVGSSFVANLMNITEVNPLPPHYVCKNCHFSAFKLSEEEKKKYERNEKQIALDYQLSRVDTGYDLEVCNCPVCGEVLDQDGVDIPFETFLGFKGEKVPDIDLNFSGEYQSRAHDFCKELFGDDHAFRAGTILTIAEKTAYGYVRKYFEKKNIQIRNAEVNRLIKKIQGVKRSTSQHPGGIVVIPKEMEYYDIVPIQYPADDVNSAWRTTHFDYHKFESNLLKLDILGHDDPTMIRHLMNFVEAYPQEFPFSKVDEIPLTDKDVFKLFSGLESMNLTPDQVVGETIGTTGLPEFGTALTKDMLSEIKPTTVSDLLKVSGLSHGTDVWNGNARDFMLGLNNYQKIPFKELIGCRDDIMVYLMAKGLPAGDAFKIMESVRKGKGVSKDFEKEMLSYNVPKWYIESCKLIKYMFPKAHATAYVIMALRIGWFKVHRPIFYYSAYFSRRASAFDVIAMANGYDSIKKRIIQLADKLQDKSASVKEIDTHYALLLALEMTARGFSFAQMDIKLSDATNFKVSKDRKKLLIPFSAMDSLGAATAHSIVDARKETEFTSKKDVLKRTKINTTLFEKMDALGVFGDLPEDDQIGLF